MPKMLLSLETLPPRVVAQVQSEIERAAADCVDRPMLEKPRKVIVTISATPTAEPSGHKPGLAPLVKFTIDVRSSAPQYASREYEGELVAGKDGRAAIVFNAASPDDVRQGTLADIADADAAAGAGERGDDSEHSADGEITQPQRPVFRIPAAN